MKKKWWTIVAGFTPDEERRLRDYYGFDFSGMLRIDSPRRGPVVICRVPRWKSRRIQEALEVTSALEAAMKEAAEAKADLARV